MKLGPLLALVASPRGARAVRGRLEGRVPTLAMPVVDSLVQGAAREDLPTEPLVQKALEGGAKRVPPQQIAAAGQVMLGQLRDARELLVRAGDAAPTTAAEGTTVYSALKRGLAPRVVARIVAALAQEPRGAALPPVPGLAPHPFDSHSASSLILDATRP